MLLIWEQKYSSSHIVFVVTKLRLCCESKKEGKDQESIQSSTTPDQGYQWESDKVTIDITNESQEVSPFLHVAGDSRQIMYTSIVTIYELIIFMYV